MTSPLVFEDVALDGAGQSLLTLAIAAHVSTSIVGEAGSGVNRLPSQALGLTTVRSGRIVVLGEDMAGMPRRAALAFRRRVGYVPADNGLLQNLTLSQNVALPLRFSPRFPRRDIDGRVRVMLALARLNDAAELRPAQANEEQRRRTSLARSLAFDPELVILDQPFAGIGDRAAAELLELARGGDTAEGSRRTVFITGQTVPHRLLPRIEVRYRIVKGQMQSE